MPIRQCVRHLVMILLVFLAGFATAQDKEPIYVFILAGQSNMSGDAGVSGLPSEIKTTFDNVIVYLDPATDGSSSRKGSWMTIEPGFGWNNGGKNSFGPELLLGVTLTEEYPDAKIALIKSSVAGTDLAKQWLSPSSGNAGRLYTGMVKCIGDALESLDEKYEPVIAGMCWMQGEADAMNSSWANNYEDNLKNFIKDIRDEVGVDAMPFIAAQIDEQAIWASYSTVNNAMKSIADSDPDVYAFPTKGFNTDGIHYQTEGMIDLGKAYAEIVIAEKMMDPEVSVPFTRKPRSFAGRIPGPFLSGAVHLFDLSGRRIHSSRAANVSNGIFITRYNHSGTQTIRRTLSVSRHTGN